jgi:integrase
MASLNREPTGSWRIQFDSPDGRRRTIRLGKLTRRTAEQVKVHIERLLESKRTGVPVDPATIQWLGTIDESLQRRLERAGLIETRNQGSLTIGRWCTDYIGSRTDLAPRTVERLTFAARLLSDYFGDKRLDAVNRGDAEAYERWLATTRGPNTVRRLIGRAKQFFGAAVKHEVITRNPFQGMVTSVRPDRSRDYFVSRETTAKLLQVCPDAQWRLIIALCRFGGLRCPTEILALRWSDVLWEQGKLNVPNVKTGKLTGESFRTIPLFPEIRPHLDEVFIQAAEGTEYVITRYRDCNANLRTQLGRIARRAGIQLWPKPFVNLRASCATELAQSYPAYVVTSWLGHSEAIAQAHYWQVTEAHFQRAIQSDEKSDVKATQNPTLQASAENCTEWKDSLETLGNVNDMPSLAESCEIVHKRTVPLRGFEPLF